MTKEKCGKCKQVGLVLNCGLLMIVGVKNARKSTQKHSGIITAELWRRSSRRKSPQSTAVKYDSMAAPA